MNHAGPILMFGDFNARMPKLENLQKCHVTYMENPDQVENAHGKELYSLCDDLDLLPLNLLVTDGLMCDGNLTFRQGTRWISQIDWALVTQNVLNSILNFRILQNIPIRTDHAALDITLQCPLPSIDVVTARAELLSHEVLPRDVTRASMPFNKLDCHRFLDQLPDPMQLMPQNAQNANDIVERVTTILRDTCTKSRKPRDTSASPHAKTALERWNKLLSMNDSKQLWKAIDWNGSYQAPPESKTMPSDSEFKSYFESLLAPEASPDLQLPVSLSNCPLLDDPIQEIEVDKEIRRMSRNKSSGPDGIPPGILTLLPLPWITLLTFLLNVVYAGHYPADWCYAKLFTIYKKGLKSLCTNYRGISILSCLCKLFDAILNSRLTLWYKPDVQQAGAQSGRGCIEQILTLRLYIDVARKTKQCLYVTFLDYEKAYDKVDRSLLLQKLANTGCSQKFLNAIYCTLDNTYSYMGNEVVEAKRGVRQGGSTSCSLFTFYINDTIRAIDAFEPDGFLGHDHILLLMDDTVLLTTTRERMGQKLSLLYQTAVTLGMTLHPSKAKFLTVNSSDTQPFHIGHIVISATNQYQYLGTIISNNTIADQI